jgi:hypothetical protein
MLSASKTAAPSGGYNLNNSLRIRGIDASAYLNRTPAGAGNRRTWTYSAWIKRGNITPAAGGQSLFYAGSSTTTPRGGIVFGNAGTDNKLSFNGMLYNTTTQVLGLETSAEFRDPSAWYHIVVVLDTTQATSSNRAKIYVNGSQVTAFGTATYPSLNQELQYNDAILHATRHPSGDYEYDGYLAEVNFIDGQALTPSSFGSTNATTGVWQPAKYTGTYGTNGFYLPFSDIATTSGSNAGLGKDFSGNANYWTTNNISVTAGTTYDAMIDVPTNTSATVANYAVLNPVIPYVAGIALSNGNLNVAYSSGSGSVGVLGTIGISSGKWYWEYTFTATNPNFYLGWRTPDGVIYFGVGCSTGNVLTETSSGSFSGSTVTVANGDVIGIAFDYAAGACYYYKNNTLFFTLTGFTTSSSTLFPIRGIWSSGGGASSGAVNFGQRPFAYTPPSGYLRLNTFNLPDSTIPQGNKYMDATTYTGNNASRSITNTGSFKPDFVWIKDRSRLCSNDLVDSVRGVNKALISDATTSEYTGSFISSFDSTGFSLPANTTSDNFYTNISGDSFVAWQWQAGQGSTSSNTSGSITTTTSVNTTAGFSVFTFTGTGASASVGHGLGVAPKFMVFKRRNSTSNWNVLTNAAGSNQYGFLDLTTAFAAAGETWTSTVINIGGNFVNGGTYVCYAWAEIAGFSAFGSFTANNSSNGNFIYLGFRPRWIMTKQTSGSGGAWFILDTARNTFNVMNNILDANTNGAERNDNIWDATANGMKLRIALSGDFIYAAFAENPFKNALAR